MEAGHRNGQAEQPRLNCYHKTAPKHPAFGRLPMKRLCSSLIPIIQNNVRLSGIFPCPAHRKYFLQPLCPGAPHGPFFQSISRQGK